MSGRDTTPKIHHLRYYGETPSGKAIEVCDPRATAAPRFLLPKSQVRILDDRREHLQRIVTIEMPAWLAAANRLDAEIQEDIDDDGFVTVVPDMRRNTVTGIGE